MKKLCFGSFATVLVRCKAKSATQKKLCGTMLLSIDSTYDIRTDDGTTSALVKGTANLSAFITDAAPSVDAKTVAHFFSSNVLPLLDNNKKGNIVLALKDIIACDDSIAADTVVERVNNITKENLATCTSFVFPEFLAGVFLYLAIYLDNRNNGENIKEITDEYIQSFESEKLNISFISQYPNLSAEAAEQVAADAHSLALLVETGGKCQNCGRPLGINKEGNDISYAKIVHLLGEDDIVLCVDCERELKNAPEATRQALLAEKHSLEQMVAATDAISRITIERQIEDVLRQISKIEIICDDETKLKFDPVPIENKIPASLLREKVVWNAKYWYKAVNTPLDHLAGENKLNVDRFAKSIKRMYEDASEKLTSLSTIYNLLVETLFDKTGRKYREACEIIISYFVQRCEVFDEITE